MNLIRSLRAKVQARLSPNSGAALSTPMLNLAALGAVMVLALAATGARAFAVPAAGDFGFDVYDIVVNQILNGPIGFIGGVALIVFGATQIMKNWFTTILCIVAGTVLIRADDLVVTLGALVS